MLQPSLRTHSHLNLLESGVLVVVPIVAPFVGPFVPLRARLTWYFDRAQVFRHADLYTMAAFSSCQIAAVIAGITPVGIVLHEAEQC